jgi:purine-nucleoside phosphorylase
VWIDVQTKMEETQIPSTTITTDFLRDMGFCQPSMGMILGTGFGRFSEMLEVEARVKYNDIPGFPVSTVAEHAGYLVSARHGKTRLVIMQGRIHRYEGYSPEQVTFPVRIMHQLGARTLFVTNAAGGLNRFFQVGDLMSIVDHIDMMGGDPPPRIGPPDFRSRPVYDEELRIVLADVAAKSGMTLRSGVLSSMLGPSFETPAEIAMLRRFGADAVSMSTVPEVVVASQLNMRIAGVSCISNMCVGDEPSPIKHEDVAVVVNDAIDRFSLLMTGMLEEINL